MIKSVRCLMSIVMCISFACSAVTVDVYDFQMSLKIPRVYNNTQSTGYRKIQTQRFTGKMIVEYIDGKQPYIHVENLVNKTQKTSTGMPIIYECEDDGITLFNYIGHNGKNQFKTPSLNFRLAAEPSYALSPMQEDNSLYLELAGYGQSSKTKNGCQIPYILSGYASGKLGCGCADYGHISPTRVIGPYGFTSIIDDIAPVYGTWKMKFKQRQTR